MEYVDCTTMPFCLQEARLYEGKLVKVKTKFGHEQGILRPLTRQTSWVGAEIVNNRDVVGFVIEPE